MAEAYTVSRVRGISIYFNCNVSNMGQEDWCIKKWHLIGRFFFSITWKLSNLMEMKLDHTSKHDCCGFIFNSINLHVDNDCEGLVLCAKIKILADS